MIFFTRHKIPLLLMLLGMLLFADLLGADRLRTWDDNRYLDENEMVQNFQVGRILTESYFAAYIPVTLLSYAAEHRLWGLAPMGYHLVNLLLHALNGALVFIFLTYLTGQKTAALMAAVLFICHPVQVETVAWISQRKNLLCMFFFLPAFISHIRARQKDSIKWQAGAWGFYLLSVLSKPAVVGAPILFMAYDYFYAHLPLRRIVRNALPFFAAALFGAAAMLVSASQVDGIIKPWGGSRWTALQLTFLVVWEYLEGLINPATLNIHYIYFPPGAVEGNVRVWAGLLLLIAFTAASVYSLLRHMRDKKNSPLPFFIFLWVMVFMLPVSNIIPINVQRADRHLYFPSIMLFLAVAVGGRRLWRHYRKKAVRGVLAGIAAAAVAGLMVMTFQRSQVWADDGTLWTHQLERIPDDDIAMNNLAMHYYRTQQYALSRPLYTKLARLAPNDYRPPLFLGLSALEQGRYEEAVRDLHHALPLAIAKVRESKDGTALGNIREEFIVAIRDKLLLAYVEVITRAEQEEQPQKAVRYTDEMLKSVPGPPQLYNGIGTMCFSEGRYPQALFSYETAVRLNPEYALAHTNKGIAAHALGKNNAAEGAFKRSLEIDSEFLPALASYCTFLQNTGRNAEDICRKAAKMRQ